MHLCDPIYVKDSLKLWYNCYILCSIMKFKYDTKKSDHLRNNPKRGIGFEEVQEIFEHFYYEDLRKDDPAQYRATGWAGGKLFTVIYEHRNDSQGIYYHLVTLWKATKQEVKNYVENI